MLCETTILWMCILIKITGDVSIFFYYCDYFYQSNKLVMNRSVIKMEIRILHRII
jgi:hypothetical protein